MLRRLTVPFVIALLMVACTPEQGPAKLTISSRTPAAGAANVAVDSVVSVTFSTAIKVASLDGEFTLAQGGAAVPGIVSYDPAARKATFTPATPLVNGAEYTATVGADVESAQGVKLGAKSSWVFTTVAAAPSVTSVTIQGGDQDVTVGDSVDLDVVVEVVGGASQAVTWSSSADAVAAVTADGVVTGVAAGTATITATSVADAEKSDSVTVTVAAAPAVTGIAIDQAAPATTVGGTVTLTATVSTVGGASTAHTWASANEAVATVDEVTGVVTGVASGTAEITVTSDADAAYSATVDVVVAEPLAFGGDYAAFVGTASVTDPISLDAPAATSSGYGDLTYALTAGALPAAFVVDDGVNPAEAFEVTVDAATGQISGVTGYPGTYTGTVTVTDSLGQTAEIDFAIDLALSMQVFNSEGTATQGTFAYTNASTTVVPGDRIRVSGVTNTEWLPADFASQLVFELDYVSAVPAQTPADAAAAFEVNTAQGTVTRGVAPTTGDDIDWTFDLVLSYGTDTATVPLVFEGVAP